MDEKELREQWEKTIGQRPDWETLSAGNTYKPAEDSPENELRDARSLFLPVQTLSGGMTLSGAAAPGEQATLSGGVTIAGSSTLSGNRTLDGAADPKAASAGTPAAAQYEIVSELGRGGMGVVFRARQASLDREVALKQLIPGQSSGIAQSKFVAEALVTGALDHPNIVPVHELGMTPSGEMFLAMKLVGGTSWKDLLHPQNEEQRARASFHDRESHIGILINVCNAVAYAHTKGVAHRDLKPENVMVGEFGEVLVMDWGIAVDVRENQDEGARAPHKSTVKAPSGTPSYMPPELAEGRGNDIGPWTDVYLLGAILHEIVTGEPPHSGPTLLSVLLSASKSEPKQYRPDVPAALRAICRKAMAREPSDRHQSVADFQAALKQYLKFRESMEICERAGQELKDLLGTGDSLARQDRNQLYGRYAKVVARYDQALELWEGNDAAVSGGRKARLAYARTALALGDLGLAEAQVSPLPQSDAEAKAIGGEIAKAQALRDRAARNSRIMKGGLIGAAAMIIVGLAIGFFLVSAEQQKTAKALETAQKERDKAAEAERLEKKQKEEAQVQRDRAEAATKEAERERDRAEEAQTLAENRKAEAETERDRADAARKDAEAAREQEKKQKEAAEQARIRAEKEEREARHRLGAGFAQSAIRYDKDGFRFDACLQAGRALGFAGLGPEGAGADPLFKEYLRPDSKEAAEARTVLLNAPRNFPVWSSPLATHHSDEVNAVAIDPGGRWIASGSNDRTVKLWDLKTGRLIRTIDGFSGDVFTVRFNPKGNLLAAGGRGTEISVWHVPEGGKERTLWGHGDVVTAVEYTPDGMRLVSGSWDRTIRVWDVNTGQTPRIIECGFQVKALSLHPDGKSVAAGGYSYKEIPTARLWSAETGKILTDFKGVEGDLYAIAISPNGKYLATGHDYNFHDAVLWDLASGKELARFKGHEHSSSCVAFTPDGKNLITVGNEIQVFDVETRTKAGIFPDSRRTTREVVVSPDGRLLAGFGNNSIVLWDLKKKTELGAFQGQQDFITSIAFSPDGKEMAVSDAKSLLLYDAETGAVKRFWREGAGNPQAVAFSDGGRTVVSFHGNRDLRLIDTKTGASRSVATEEYKKEAGYIGAFSADGNLLATTSPACSYNGNYRTHLFDAGSGKMTLRIEGPERPYSVAVSADGSMVAVGGMNDGKIAVYAVKDGKRLLSLDGHTNHMEEMAFSPDGAYLASADRDQVLRIWTIPEGKAKTRLETYRGTVSALTFDPASRALATGESGGTVRLWDMQEDKFVNGCASSARSVGALAFSPDGKTLAYGAEDWTVKFLAAGETIPARILGGHEAIPRSVAFSPDGGRLATGGADGKILIWDPANQIKVAEIKAGDKDVYALAFSPDGETLCSGDWHGAVRLWRTADGSALRRLAEVKGKCRRIRYEKGGKMLAVSGCGVTGGGLKVFDAKTMDLIHDLEAAPIDFVFLPGKNLLVSASDSGLSFWDMKTGKKSGGVPAEMYSILSMAASPDGRFVAAAGGWEYIRDYGIRVWETDTWKLLGSMEGANERVWSLDFSPDGKQVASSHANGRIHLWDVPTLSMFATLVWPWQCEYGSQAVYSPDGKRLAIVGYENEARLWDIGLPRLTDYLSLGGFDGDKFVFDRDLDTLSPAGNPWDGILAKARRR